MTRVLVVGGAGMLGHKLCAVLGRRMEVLATFRHTPPDVREAFGAVTPIIGVDATDVDRIDAVLADVRPDIVINAVGIVKQLAAAKDPIPSIVVNSLLPHRLAALAEARGAKLIHISTDCVFSGDRGAYRESDIPDPVDLYGRSKLLGEVGPPALTLRTSIIGRELETRVGLVEWFLSQAGGRVRGFAGAIYTGVTTATLADMIGSLIDAGVPLEGLWHVSTTPISKFELLQKLNAEFNTRTHIDRDEDFRCDRSLASEPFWARTGLSQPAWPAMIRALRDDPVPYERIHGARTQA